MAAGAWLRCELRYTIDQSPQTGIFNVLHGTEPHRAAQTLLSTPTCCQDDFTDRLRSLASGPEDLCQGPLHDALAALADSVAITIDSEERAHSLNRQIARPSTRAPVTVDRLRHESLLQAAMRTHLRGGGSDSSLLDRKTLSKHGLRTVRSGRARQRRRLPVAGNPQMLFSNWWRAQRELDHGVHGVHGVHTGGPASLARLARLAWADLSRGQKAQWKVKWNLAIMQAKARAIAPEGSPRSQRSPRSPLGDHGQAWQLGDDSWPLSASRLESFICRHGARDKLHTGRPGPRNVGRAVAAQDARRSLVADPAPHGAPEHLPPGEQCGRVHPGICRTQHAAMYKQALILCANMRQLFSSGPRSSCVGLFLRFHASGGQACSVYAVLCEILLARPVVGLGPLP